MARTITTVADPDELIVARDELGRTLAETRWRSDERFRVLVATGEAIANALDHGTPPGGRIRIAWAVCETRVEVVVEDEGRGSPWDGRSASPPSTAARGRGCLLMRGLCDRAVIHSTGAGTRVVLEFDLRTADGEARQ